MKYGNQMEQLAYRIGTAFGKLTFHLRVSYSSSLILNSLCWKSASLKLLRNYDQQFRIFSEFKEIRT